MGLFVNLGLAVLLVILCAALRVLLIARYTRAVREEAAERKRAAMVAPYGGK